MNRNLAYKSFQEKDMNKELIVNKPDGLTLSQTMLNYSGIAHEYLVILKDLILLNNLQEYDNRYYPTKSLNKENMKFTAPLKSDSIKIMLLGSGELGKEVIIGSRLGIETIAVDSYNNAPAQLVANKSYTINMKNENEILML